MYFYNLQCNTFRIMTASLPKKSNAKKKAGQPAEHPIKNRITVMIEDYLKFSGDYKFLESVLNFIPEPMTIKNSKGEFLVYNEAIENLGGYRRDEAVGKSISITGQKKFVEEINKADEEVLNTGISSNIETDFQKPDGELLQLSITKHRINLPNNEHGILTIGNDITKKKRYEDIVNIQYTIDYLETLNQGLESTIRNILEYIFRLYWIDGAGVYIYDPDARKLDLISHAGLSHDFIKDVKSYDIKSNQLKTLLKKENIYMRTRDLPESSKKRNNKEGILFTAAIPLVNKETNELVGNLNLASKKYEQISEEDKKGIESISRRIVNLILYAQSQEKLKESHTLLEQKVSDRTRELSESISQLTHEIQDHILTKKTLEESETLFRAIFENDQVGLLLYDASSYKLLKFNTKIHTELGYTKSQFLKLKRREYVKADTIKVEEILNRLMNNEKLVLTEKLIHKSGEYLDYLLNASVIRIGDKAYLLGILQNITELLKKDEAIKVSEEKYRKLQENLPIGIFTTNFEGKFLHVNPSSVRIFGYKSADELMKVPVTDVYYSKEKRSEFLQALLADGKLIKKEVQLVRKDKTVFWGLISAQAVFNREGNPFLFDGIVEDISEIKSTRLKLEESNKKITSINQNLETRIQETLSKQEEQNSLLIQKSKLESLGELSAGIAHEINQPLGVMALTFENLKIKINSQKLTPHYLETKFLSIEDNIKRIRDIIDHIRTFSRDQESFVLDKVNINKAIRKALSMIGVQYRNHNINIKLDLNEEIGFTVGSNLKVEQVILNLLSNSKYALEEKGTIVSEAEFSKEILIKTDSTEHRIILMVEDNGIGIKAKHLARIFDPFFTTKPEGFGTGLGLSIVYGLVKDMRGEILVNSMENKFTKFKITYPRFPEKA
jgi:PAS domain S-box-containing protein